MQAWNPADYKIINKVSVVVLAYNNYSCLKKCISSVARQKYDNIEIILADDCSKDIKSHKIEETIRNIVKDRFGVICIFNPQNMGTVRNFNNAVERSTGDLIIPLAMDDVFADENSVSYIVDYFNEKRVLVATSYSCRICDSKMMIGPVRKEVDIYSDPEITIQRLFKYGLFFKGANTYYHKQVFSVLGKFDESFILYEDVPFLYKYLKSGFSISIVPYICVIYSVDCGVSSKKGGSQLLRNDRVKLFRNILDSDGVDQIKRNIKYNLYRNMYPEKKLTAALKYPDVIFDKLIFSFFNKNKFVPYHDEKEIRECIWSFNNRKK